MQLPRPASVTPAFIESQLMLNRHQLAISSFGDRRLGRLLAVAAIEPINASGRIDQFLLAGKEGMASGANLDVEIFFAGRARFESFAARASYCDFLIFWMNSRFHFSFTYMVVKPSFQSNNYDTDCECGWSRRVYRVWRAEGALCDGSAMLMRGKSLTCRGGHRQTSGSRTRLRS